MWKTSIVTISLLAILGGSPANAQGAPQTQDPGMLLRAAMEKEEVDGDLQGAIDLYTQIVAKFADQATVAAKAQLRIGMCFEKLGRAEAVKAYEAVLAKFPKEAEVVAEARARLAALRQGPPAGLTMARLALPDTYLECPTLSPDGTKVAAIEFSTGQNVIVYDLATKKTNFVTDYGYNAKSPYTYVPVWSPDGTKIAYETGTFNAPARELWVSELGGESRLIFENAPGVVAPCDWLPDGSAIVAVLRREDGSIGLGVVSLADRSFREVHAFGKTIDDQRNPTQADAGASVDVSPDGRVFAIADGPPDGKRDIYVVPAAGGAPVALTDHPADDKEPRWSPDGRHIVFLSDRHGSWALWGVAIREGKADGPPFLILEGMQDSQLASWSSAGLQTRTTIVLSDIYILQIDPERHVAVAKPRVLDLNSSNFNMGARWSPDGKHLMFVTYVRTGPSRGSFNSIMPAEGGEIRKVKFSLPIRQVGGAGGWLPDSSGLGAVVWDSEKRLSLARLDLSSEEWTSQLIPAGSYSAFLSFAWRGDGKAIYYFKREGDDVAEPGIVEHELDTGRERYIFHAGPDEDFGWQLHASRDYKRLALDNDGAIVVVDTETGQVQRMENREKKQLFHPSWSPDGKFLVAKGSPDEKSDSNELFIVSLSDGTFRSLDISRFLPRKSRIMAAPDWSPDGRKIAFDTRSWRSEANLIRNVILPEQ